MDIKTFVRETLTQIVEGVSEAEALITIGASGAKVNPVRTMLSEGERGLADAQPVEFDIAVTVATEEREGAESKVGGGLQVLSVVGVKFGASVSEQASGGHRSETISRVKFAVQLVQPGHTTIARPKPIAYT